MDRAHMFSLIATAQTHFERPAINPSDSFQVCVAPRNAGSLRTESGAEARSR